MNQPQSAICTESGAFGLFVTALVNPGGEEAVRKAAAALPALTEKLAAELDEPGLVSAIAFGPDIWPRLFGTPAPKGLLPFQALQADGRKVPSTPTDLFLHIHANRPDAPFQLGRRMLALLGGAVTLAEDVQGFRTHQNRDLTGFVDGTENPKGDERAEVALTEDGGSFVNIQRWEHDLAKWESLDIAHQENVIGRTKADNEEMDDETKPPSAHIARVAIKEDGRELEILRHGLPYGDMRRHGLYFVAYAADPNTFRKMLKSMVEGDRHGHADKLMDYTKPMTGASFFAPAASFLTSLTKPR